MTELAEKVKTAIARLKAFEPETEPYCLCYSGGKDSDCIRILAQLAGVRHDIVHNLTTVDAPETIAYIKSIPNVIIEKAMDKDGNRITMWNLIPKKGMPPTRLVRYCCSVFKEKGGKGRMKITGVRMSESVNRQKNGGMVKIIGKEKTMQKYAEENSVAYEQSEKGGIILNMDNSEQRRMVEHCYRTTSTMLNPIYDWEEQDVLDFLHHYNCEKNPLYQCGQKRIGCIGCPMKSGRGMKEDFSQYPKYKAAYIRAFDRMLIEMDKRNIKHDWQTGKDVMKWWTGDDPNQMSFFDDDE